MPLSALLELHDPVGCVSADLLAAELDARAIGGVTVEVRVAPEGDERRLGMTVRQGLRVLGVPGIRIAGADCPDAPAAIGAKVAARLVEAGWCAAAGDDDLACRASPLLARVEAPIGVSVGVGAPLEARALVGVRAVLDPGPVRILAGGEGTVGTAFAVGAGTARMAEALLVVGAAASTAGVLDVEAGVVGGAVYGWGDEGLVGARLTPTVAGWVGVSAPLSEGLHVGLAARGYVVRLGLCEGFGATCPAEALVSEPWVRVEARIVPTIGPPRKKRGAR